MISASFPSVPPSAVKRTALTTFMELPESNKLLPISTSEGIPACETTGAGYSRIKSPSDTPSPIEFTNTILPLRAWFVTFKDKRRLDTFCRITAFPPPIVALTTSSKYSPVTTISLPMLPLSGEKERISGELTATSFIDVESQPHKKNKQTNNDARLHFLYCFIFVSI